MPCDCRIGFVRESEFAQPDAPIACSGDLARRRRGQELVDDPLHVVSAEIDRNCLADHGTAGAEQPDRRAFGWRLAEHSFLGGGARSAERRALGNREPHPRSRVGDPALNQRGECEIDVVAAEQQVISDRDTFERRHAGFDPDANQTEVCRAAADVAHERQSIVFSGRRFRSMFGHPCVERGDRLLQERQICELGRPRCFDRQLARLLVERRGHRQHNALALQPQPLVAARNRGVPCIADVHQVPRGRVDRRDARTWRCTPREDRSSPIDTGMRQP